MKEEEEMIRQYEETHEKNIQIWNELSKENEKRRLGNNWKFKSFHKVASAQGSFSKLNENFPRSTIKQYRLGRIWYLADRAGDYKTLRSYQNLIFPRGHSKLIGVQIHQERYQTNKIMEV